MRARTSALSITTAGLVLAIQILFASAAHAAPGDPVLVSDADKLELTVNENGEGSTSVSVLNPSDDVLNLVAEPSGGTDHCAARLSTAAVQPHTQGTLKVTFAKCSSETRTSGSFTVSKTASGKTTALFGGALSATQEETTPEVDWGYLRWFGIAAAIAAVVVFFTWLGWALARTSYKSEGADEQRGFVNLIDGLPGLDSSWTFKESWASNATVIAAALTGLFGATEVTKTLLGDDSKAVLTLVAVATAGALGLAGIAPLLLQACRRPWASEVTPLGIWLASVATLTATGGELGVTVEAVYDTEALNQTLVLVAGIVGGVLLLLYAIMATLQNLETGATVEADDEAESDPVDVKKITNDVLDVILERVSQVPQVNQRYLDGFEVPTPPATIEVQSTVRRRKSRRRTAIL